MSLEKKLSFYDITDIQQNCLINPLMLDAYFIINSNDFLNALEYVTSQINKISFNMNNYINELTKKIESNDTLEIDGTVLNYVDLKGYLNYLNLVKLNY